MNTRVLEELLEGHLQVEVVPRTRLRAARSSLLLALHHPLACVALAGGDRRPALLARARLANRPNPSDAVAVTAGLVMSAQWAASRRRFWTCSWTSLGSGRRYSSGSTRSTSTGSARITCSV